MTDFRCAGKLPASPLKNLEIFVQQRFVFAVPYK
jgi:hypothetical protein